MPKHHPKTEQELLIKKLTDEVFWLRYCILGFVAPPYRDFLRFGNLTPEQAQQWPNVAIESVMNAVKPDKQGRAKCPLCGDGPSSGEHGYLLPLGLRRHLLGRNGSGMCKVMYAAYGMLRDRKTGVLAESAAQ